MLKQDRDCRTLEAAKEKFNSSEGSYEYTRLARKIHGWGLAGEFEEKFKKKEENLFFYMDKKISDLEEKKRLESSQSNSVKRSKDISLDEQQAASFEFDFQRKKRLKAVVADEAVKKKSTQKKPGKATKKPKSKRKK